jgi:hypothetical protein
VDVFVAVLLGLTFSVLVYLTPALVAARGQPGVDTSPVVSGVLVAWHGIYFFTVLALALAFLAALRRGAAAIESVILAVAGLGFFEFVYGLTYAVTTSQTRLLLPSSGLPATGWAGFGTWVLAELLVASFVLIGWDRGALDRFGAVAGGLFIFGLTLWDVALGWRYPPYDNSGAVYLVNTLTEVAGTLLLPLVFSTRSRAGPDFLHRMFRRTFGRLVPTRPG